MKIVKNTHLDIAYIQLKKGTIAKTIEIKPGMLVDIDKTGEILGIEILSIQKLAPHLKLVKNGLTHKKAA